MQTGGGLQDTDDCLYAGSIDEGGPRWRANDEFGAVVRLIARTSLRDVPRCVGVRLDTHTEDIPRITVTPPHPDSSDGTDLSISLASAIAVDCVAVSFVFRCRVGRVDDPCGYGWLGKDGSPTCGCNWYDNAGRRCSGCA